MDIEDLIGTTLEIVFDHEWHHSDAIPTHRNQRRKRTQRNTKKNQNSNKKDSVTLDASP